MEVAAALLAGGVGLPVPEELALLSAGYWLVRGVDARLMVTVAVAAVLTGDLIMYLAGRCGMQLAGARSSRLEAAFARRGPALLLVGRFVPGVRAALLVTAGAARVPLLRLIACDGTAALAGAAVWISVGVRLADKLERARAIVGQVRGVVFVVVAVAALLLVAYRSICMPTSMTRSGGRPK